MPTRRSTPAGLCRMLREQKLPISVPKGGVEAYVTRSRTLRLARQMDNIRSVATDLLNFLSKAEFRRVFDSPDFAHTVGQLLRNLRKAREIEYAQRLHAAIHEAKRYPAEIELTDGKQAPLNLRRRSVKMYMMASGVIPGAQTLEEAARKTNFSARDIPFASTMARVLVLGKLEREVARLEQPGFSGLKQQLLEDIAAREEDLARPPGKRRIKGPAGRLRKLEIQVLKSILASPSCNRMIADIVFPSVRKELSPAEQGIYEALFRRYSGLFGRPSLPTTRAIAKDLNLKQSTVQYRLTMARSNILEGLLELEGSARN